MHVPELTGPWRFRLMRAQDETGVSGVGYIADGVRFRDGTCVLRWRTRHASTAVYASHETLMEIHGHGGKTECEWVDQPPTEAFDRGAENCMLDSIENAPFSSVGGLDRRECLQAPNYITTDDAPEYLRGYIAQARGTYGEDWRTCSFGWAPVMTIGGDE
jgi:hypothetical protein